MLAEHVESASADSLIAATCDSKMMGKEKRGWISVIAFKKLRTARTHTNIPMFARVKTRARLVPRATCCQTRTNEKTKENTRKAAFANREGPHQNTNAQAPTPQAKSGPTALDKRSTKLEIAMTECRSPRFVFTNSCTTNIPRHNAIQRSMEHGIALLPLTFVGDFPATNSRHANQTKLLAVLARPNQWKDKPISVVVGRNSRAIV